MVRIEAPALRSSADQTSDFDLHGDARVAAKDIYDFDAGCVASRFRIYVSRIAYCPERPIFTCAIILPMMVEWLFWMPVEIHGPKIYEIKAVFCGSLFEGFQLFRRNLCQ